MAAPRSKPQCGACSRISTRWVTLHGVKHRSCTICYNRVLRGGVWRRQFSSPALEHKKALTLALEMMRKGATIQAAADKVGMTRKTLMARIGRLASLEAI